MDRSRTQSPALTIVICEGTVAFQRSVPTIAALDSRLPNRKSEARDALTRVGGCMQISEARSRLCQKRPFQVAKYVLILHYFRFPTCGKICFPLRSVENSAKK